jgi:predicted NBD/HSP70 family sugar kinase
MQSTAHRAQALRMQGALAVLRHVHAHPGVTRAELTRALGLSSGSAAEITARLKVLRLVEETEAPATGGRGRPSPVLTAHPDGPVICAVEIGHESWRVATVELGGRLVGDVSGRHADRAAGAVLDAVRHRIPQADRRLRAVSVAVAGRVQGTRVVQAATLGWRDVDLAVLRPDPGVPLLVGNDASLAGLAEARRGAGFDTKVVLHLTVEVGLGGILVVDGRPMTGATGAGGEFGHLPFGDRERQCPCGARGCWDLEVDGRAMARDLGLPEPRDPRTEADRILRSADAAHRAAVTRVATTLGRGIGGLVNALDPDLVTLSGLARSFLAEVPEALHAGYADGLMSFRRAEPPPLRPSTLGDQGPVIGAAEVAFDALLTEEGLAAWE